MKTKRLLLAGLSLAILVAFIVAICLGSTPEPSYNSKRLSSWFKEYTGVMPGQYVMATPNLFFSTNRPTWITASNRGNFIVVSNRQGWLVLTNQPVLPPAPPKPSADDPWFAIRAIGSNAAPYLAAQMRHGRWERFYERNYTNVPALLRKYLPNPSLKSFHRSRAIEIASRLGSAAHNTAPAMLELLHEGNPSLMSALPRALRSVQADRSQIAGVILRFGAEKRYPEVLRLVGEFGAEDPGVARLLGQLLAGPNPKFHQDAIRLLEASGARAAPAAPEIIAAHKNPDAEVRYLAARSVEMLSQRISQEERPALEQLLRAALADKSVIVRNVSRRVLTKMGVTDLPAPLED